MTVTRDHLGWPRLNVSAQKVCCTANVLNLTHFLIILTLTIPRHLNYAVNFWTDFVKKHTQLLLSSDSISLLCYFLAFSNVCTKISASPLVTKLVIKHLRPELSTVILNDLLQNPNTTHGFTKTTYYGS